MILLSTYHHDAELGSDEDHVKPKIILDYNLYKGMSSVENVNFSY